MSYIERVSSILKSPPSEAFTVTFTWYYFFSIRISTATFTQLVDNMEDYLSLPSERLGILSQRWQEKTTATKLVQQVQQGSPSPAKAGSIVEGIIAREEQRQLKFNDKMNEMGETRTKLAHSLTTALRHVEKQTGEFLIKPVFYRRPPPPARELITPIPRPFPPSRLQSAGVAGQRHHRTGGNSRASTTSSNVRMIQSYLHSQRQRSDPQQLIRCVDSASELGNMSKGHFFCSFVLCVLRGHSVMSQRCLRNIIILTSIQRPLLHYEVHGPSVAI